MPSLDPVDPPLAVEVSTPARIHLGMLSFGRPDCRGFGGVGLMLDRPGVVLRVRRAERDAARGPDAERALAFARDCRERIGCVPFGCAIEVVAAPRPHVGLGSGTQLGLAVAAAVSRLAGGRDGRGSRPGDDGGGPAGRQTRSFDLDEVLGLARLAGRGRRSCVGIYGFCGGGLIVEAGRHAGQPAEDQDRAFSPLLNRVELPAEWRCVLIVERTATGLSGEAERRAFAALPPVPVPLSAELSRLVLLEMLPAAIEARFADFAAAVSRYGRLAGEPFAAASSRVPHAAATARLLDLLEELGAGGRAQSSWGPAVIACCESPSTAAGLLERLDQRGLAADHEITVARFDTRGAVLRDL